MNPLLKAREVEFYLHNTGAKERSRAAKSPFPQPKAPNNRRQGVSLSSAR
jgi:hypothetical protein